MILLLMNGKRSEWDKKPLLYYHFLRTKRGSIMIKVFFGKPDGLAEDHLPPKLLICTIDVIKLKRPEKFKKIILLKLKGAWENLN